MRVANKERLGAKASSGGPFEDAPEGAPVFEVNRILFLNHARSVTILSIQINPRNNITTISNKNLVIRLN